MLQNTMKELWCWEHAFISSRISFEMYLFLLHFSCLALFYMSLVFLKELILVPMQVADIIT